MQCKSIYKELTPDMSLGAQYKNNRVDKIDT